LTFCAELSSAAAKLAAAVIPSPAAAVVSVHERAVPVAIFAVVSFWWIGAMVAVLRSFAPRPRLATIRRAATLLAALLAVSALVPHAPIFVGRNFDIRTANLWESLHARFATAETDGGPPGSEQAQRSLLQTEVASLAPRKKDATNI